MHLSIFALFDWIFWLATPANWLIVLSVAGGLGFVIFVHELGHFLVAKACGVKCEKFYLGFDIYGLKLFKFQWGETEYGIGILPLGGYVKMLGQDDNPAKMAEETRRAKQQAANTPTANDPVATAEHAPVLTHGDLPPEPVSDPHVPYDPRSYMAQSVPKRMAIISAGVIMNVIFAFLMASLAYGLGVTETPCIVGTVTAGGTAWKAGLQPGDEIIRIGNLKEPRYRDLQTRVPLSDTKEGIEFEIRRPGVEKPFVVRLFPENAVGVPLIGVRPTYQTRLSENGRAIPDSAADKAEPPLKPSDRIAKIGEQEVASFAELQKLLLQKMNDALQVTAARPPQDLLKSLQESSDEKLTPQEIERRLNEESKPVELSVPTTPVRDVGLVMTMGPISSVRKDSPADNAGIKAGDIVLTIDGEGVGNPLTLPNRLMAKAKQGDSVTLEVERTKDEKVQKENEKEKLSFTVKLEVPEWYYPTGLTVDPVAADPIGIAYQVVAKVKSVIPGSPAAAADIAPGDVVTKFQFLAPKETDDAKEKAAKKKKSKDKGEKGNDKNLSEANGDEAEEERPPRKDSNILEINEKTPAWAYLVLDELTLGDPEMKVKLWIDRDGEEHTVEITPSIAKLEDGSDWNVPERGFNFKPVTFVQVAKSLGEAFQLGGRETVDNLLMVYRFLQRIGQGRISLKMTAGPVGIAQMAGMKVKEGFASFLLFLTMLSANLAVINFLPIPVLDGGHMVFLAYEGIRGKPASERVIIAFTYAGLIFLLTLMLFVLSLDIGLISRR